MLKVIISDDEIKVCQLIYHLVDWAEMELEVVAIENDGKKAFDSICEKRPDIVITDIRMPNYDGIELIRRVKEIHPNIYFIIVSGYSQFEYAQNAIKYGVEDYLLKPLKKKELISTLNKIKEKHNLAVSNVTEKKVLKSMLNTTAEKAKKNLLTEILVNPESKILSQSKEELNKEFYSQFQDGYYSIILIKPFLESEEENKEMFSLLLTKIQCMLKDRLEICCKEIISIIWEEQIICLINTEDASLSAIKKSLNKMKIEISNLKEIFQSVRVIIGSGKAVDHLSDIYCNLRQAQTAVLSRFSKPEQYIIEYQEDMVSNILVSSVVDNTMRNKIISSFEVMDLDGILEEITELENRLTKHLNDGRLIYGCYLELVNIILFASNHSMKQNEFPDSVWFQKKFHTFLTITDLFQCMRQLLKEEFERFLAHKKLMDSRPIRVAKQYINENYNNEISLESVSGLIGFNPAYFSSLFKKETGENFMEYVMKIRIQNAKDFLLQTDKDVADIAADVGYTDLKYFSKLFKKKTGLNPTEFRRIYG